jgi:hypothetical protein
MPAIRSRTYKIVRQSRARLASDRQRFIDQQGRQRDRQPPGQRGRPPAPKRARPSVLEVGGQDAGADGGSGA